MSRSQRLAFALIAAVIAVIAVVVLTSGADDEETAATTPTTATEVATPPSQQEEEATATATPEPEEAEPAEPEATQIEVKGGEVVGGVEEIRVKQGERIRFSVTADSADEVHVHGFDVSKPVSPGKPAEFNIAAKIVGIFEVELEGSHVQVASLRVEQ